MTNKWTGLGERVKCMTQPGADMTATETTASTRATRKAARALMLSLNRYDGDNVWRDIIDGTNFDREATAAIGSTSAFVMPSGDRIVCGRSGHWWVA